LLRVVLPARLWIRWGLGDLRLVMMLTLRLRLERESGPSLVRMLLLRELTVVLFMERLHLPLAQYLLFWMVLRFQCGQSLLLSLLLLLLPSVFPVSDLLLLPLAPHSPQE
jgi:hypothetical protein